MNIESKVAIPALLALLTVFGCNEAHPAKSGAIERSTSTEPTLTSTASLVSPEAFEPKPPKPALVEAADVPSVEEGRPFEPSVQSLDGLRIKRFVTAPKVEDREPVAPSSVFAARDQAVYAFVDVSNTSEEQKSLSVHFLGPNGQVSGGIELHIPAAVPRWRTWAYTKHANDPGLWHVEIRSVDGTLLGTLPFEVRPGG